MEITLDRRQPQGMQGVAPEALDADRRTEPDVAFAVFEYDVRRQ
jgi:hypothetical protein